MTTTNSAWWSLLGEHTGNRTLSVKILKNDLVLDRIH